MRNFYEFSLTVAGKDESSIIFRLEVFECDGGFAPPIDVVSPSTEVNLHLLQGVETHVVRGLVDGGRQGGYWDGPGVDAKRSPQVYSADPVFPMPDGQYVNDVTLRWCFITLASDEN